MPDLEELLSKFDPERQERLRQLIARRKQYTPQQLNPEAEYGARPTDDSVFWNQVNQATLPARQVSPNIAWQSHVQPQQPPDLWEMFRPDFSKLGKLPAIAMQQEQPAFYQDPAFQNLQASIPQTVKDIGQKITESPVGKFTEALTQLPIWPTAPGVGLLGMAKKIPKGEFPKPSENPYLKMPIKRVQQDAEKGVNLAKEALEARKGGIGKVPEPKEPWQMTLDRYESTKEIFDTPENPTLYKRWMEKAGVDKAHKESVEKALSEGKPVPAEVLKDYPDLEAKAIPEAKVPEKVAPEVKTITSADWRGMTSDQRLLLVREHDLPDVLAYRSWRQLTNEERSVLTTEAAIPKAEAGMPEIPVTETKPPAVPPPPKAPMTPDDADRILSDFGKALKSPQTKQAFQLQEELRSAERGVRQQKFKEILDTEVAKGTTFEEALNKATVSFGGELPKMKSGIVLPESIKEAAYAKIVRVIRNTPDLPNKEYEIASTRKAFDDALAGVKAISAKPGTAGGSALSRLQRVFSDNKELMDILKDPESYAMKMAKSPTELDRNLLTYLRELPPDKTNQLSLIEPTRRMKLIENMQKVGVNVIDVLNLPRAFITAYDLSAPLRQALVLGTRYPKLWGSEFKPMIKALFSEDFGMAVDKQIRNNPIIADGMGRFGLDLPSLSKNVAMRYREESFMSRFAERIPGVRASQRAYLTFLNKFRADVWTKNVDILKKVGATDNDYKEFAQFINWATGRGSLPKPLVGSAPALNALLFSPRLVFSRLELPAKLVSSSPYVRKEAAKTLVTFLGFGALVLGLVKLAGGYVEFDPRSSEFAKVRVGNTRLDIWGGYVQYARFVSQLTSGQRKTTEGFEEELDRWTTIQRFLQSKQSPGMGLFVDIMRGETYAGEEMSTESESLRQQAYNRLVPLFVQDIIDAIKEEGLPTGLVGLPSGLGVGVVTYKENARLIAPNRGSLEGMVSELKRLDKKVGYAGAEIAGETLTTEQKKIYQEATTAEISKALNQLFTSDSYNKANDVNRKYMTDETVASARLRARESLVPTLPSKAQMRYKITQNGGSIAQFEKTLGLKWDDPKSEAIIRTADKYLTPYYRIESDVWNQTGTIPGTNIQYKAASDAWEKLAKKDAQKAKEVIFNSDYGPTILYARKEILLKQRDMKFNTPMLRAIWKLFY